MSIDVFLTIDTIVLHGLHGVDRHTLEEAVKDVLLENLTAEGVLSAAELSRVRTNITLHPVFTSEQLGHILGRSLTGVISNAHVRQDRAQERSQGGQCDE